MIIWQLKNAFYTVLTHHIILFYHANHVLVAPNLHFPVGEWRYQVPQSQYYSMPWRNTIAQHGKKEQLVRKKLF